MNVTLAIVDLHIAERTHFHVYPAVVILQADVPRNIFEPDILGAGNQVHWSRDFLGMKIVGIQAQVAVDLGELHVGARRLESDALADMRQFHALLELAVELDGAVTSLTDVSFSRPSTCTSPVICSILAEPFS